MRKIILALLIASLSAGGYFVYKMKQSPPQESAVLHADLNDSVASTGKNPRSFNIPIVAPEDLVPTPTHKEISYDVVKKTIKSHYARKPLDVKLSRLAYDRYLEMLDSNKHYFLASDIAEFSELRDSHLSAISTGNPEKAFDLFKRYQERARDRMQYSLDLLESQPDLDTKDVFIVDRDEQPYVNSKVEWDALWRQRVTNDVITQFLADKDWEETRKTLTARYKTALRQIDQQQPNDVFQLFMNSYVDSLDPHSGYFSPKNEDERNLQSSLTYTGIGASLNMQDEYVTVANIIPGGPAQQTELVKVDDHIIGVGQEGEAIQDVFGWRLDDVVQMIRGPSDSKVHLRLIRDVAGIGDSEIEIELIRNKITLEAQAAKKEIIELEENDKNLKIGVIKIPSFYQDYRGKRAGNKDYKSTTKDVYRLIQELEADNTDGLIIDLRNNGGGNLEEAINLTGLFIDKGPVVQFRSSRGASYVYEDNNELTDIAYSGPLTVLVNRYSASASEIFAAAIQDYQRGVIVGQTTFGKGTVQEQIPLQGSFLNKNKRFGLLSLTIGKFYRVNGGSTQHRGVIPDIELPSYISLQDVGESTEASALPWDQIRQSKYSLTKDVDANIIRSLRELQTQRAQQDPDMIYLQNDISSIQALRDRKAYSLNLEQRLTEREYNQQQRLKRENDRRRAQGLETYKDFSEFEDADALDIQLDQASHIMADLLTGQPEMLSMEKYEESKESGTLLN